MLDHDESFLVSSVVFGADMWTTIGHLSYIHDAYISLHITHNHNHNNSYVYIVILIFIYRIFVNSAMRQTTSFEAL